MFFIFSYGYGRRNTKKIGVLAAHGDEEPPETLDAHYVTDIMYYFDNPEKTPFSLVMGDTSAGDATELKWELDEDLDRCFVSFPVDQ